jgi:hypothetical protein
MFYDFGEFLNSVKYLDKEDILATSYKRHKALDKITSADKREGGSGLQNNIQYLLFFLEKNERHPEMTEDNFVLLKPVCENLVKKDQMEPGMLKLF